MSSFRWSALAVIAAVCIPCLVGSNGVVPTGGTAVSAAATRPADAPSTGAAGGSRSY